MIQHCGGGYELEDGHGEEGRGVQEEPLTNDSNERPRTLVDFRIPTPHRSRQEGSGVKVSASILAQCSFPYSDFSRIQVVIFTR